MTISKIILPEVSEQNFKIDELDNGDLVYILPPETSDLPVGIIGMVVELGVVILEGVDIGYCIAPDNQDDYDDFLYQKVAIGTKVVLEKTNE